MAEMAAPMIRAVTATPIQDSRMVVATKKPAPEARMGSTSDSPVRPGS